MESVRRRDVTTDPDPEDEDEEADEPLDPRVQVELETLNSAADSINKLENELQRARAKFRLLKSESSQRLSALNRKIGRKWVIKARPYYDLLRQSSKTQAEAQRAALRFQRASSVYLAAKETITLAEQQLMGAGGGRLAFDAAWQEMLNHATMRFMDAEKEKRASQLEHETRAGAHSSIQLRLGHILSDMTRTINKAKPFYELKDKLECRLQTERQNAEDLHLALICAKQKYKMSLVSLEHISNDLHSHRLERRQLLSSCRRTPGVGAESSPRLGVDSDTWSEMSELPSVNLDFMSEAGSQASFEDFDDLDLDLNDWDDPPPTHTPPTSPPLEATSPPEPAMPFWSRFSGNFKSSSTNNAHPVAGGVVRPPTPLRGGQGGARDNLVEGAEAVIGTEQQEAGPSKLPPADIPHRHHLIDSSRSQPVATPRRQPVATPRGHPIAVPRNQPAVTPRPVDRDVFSAMSSLGLGGPPSTPQRPLGGNSAALHWGPAQGGRLPPIGKPPLPFHRSPSGKIQGSSESNPAVFPSVQSSPSLSTSGGPSSAIQPAGRMMQASDSLPSQQSTNEKSVVNQPTKQKEVTFELANEERDTTEAPPTEYNLAGSVTRTASHVKQVVMTNEKPVIDSDAAGTDRTIPLPDEIFG